MIRPLRIIEIGCAVCADESVESIGGHRRPSRVVKIRAGFHHDNQDAAAGDVETKFVRPHAKASIAGLGLWIPEHYRTTGKEGIPSRGSRQVIDGGFIVTEEHCSV